MKKTRITSVWLVALGLVLLWPQATQAFYNPTTGRWLNRDPAVEEAFFGPAQDSALKDELTADLNEVAFVANDPLRSFDYLGLSIARALCACSSDFPAGQGHRFIEGSITVGDYDVGLRRATCAYSNQGQTESVIFYPDCEEKSAWYSCYNCAKWHCRVQRVYMCSKHKGRLGRTAPVWRLVAQITLNHCGDLTHPPR